LVFKNILLGGTVLLIFTLEAVFVYRNSRNVGNAPGGYFRIPMLTDDIGMDVSSIYMAMLTEKVSKSGAVQDGSGSNHLSMRQAGYFKGHICQQIYGIGHYEDHTLPILLYGSGHNGLKNLHIPLEQINTGFSRLLVDSGRQNDDLGIRTV
jgi:hypothetical protein